MFHLDIHASMLYQHVGMIVLVCLYMCIHDVNVSMSLLCYCYIIHVSLMGYIQTCLNSLLNSFISTVHLKIFCCPYTVINPVLHLSFFIKGCIIYLIKLQASV